MSLRTKTLLPLAFFSLVLLAYLYAYWMPSSLANMEAGHQRSLELHMDSVTEGLIPLLLGHQLDTIYENLSILQKRNKDWISIQLLDAEGRTIYPLSTSPTTARHGKNVHILRQQIKYLDMDLGLLVVAVDFAPRLSEMKKKHWELITAALIIIAAFIVTIGFILERVVIRPVNLLARASQRLAEGGFDVPLVKAGDDEVGTLVDSFEDMRKAIREYRSTLRSAHEQLQGELAERKQAEVLLRKSNEMVERIFSMTTTCIAYMDCDYKFIRVNKEYAGADGKTPEYFIGKNHFDLFPNEENEAIFRKVVETGEQYIAKAKPFEYKDHPERGVSHWDWSLTPVKDAKGTVEALILSLVNVTERIKAQEDLSKINEELEQRVSERTAELEKKNAELGKMNKLFVGRELRMIELKERIKELEKKVKMDVEQ